MSDGERRFRVVEMQHEPDCIMGCISCGHEFPCSPVGEENVTRIRVNGALRLTTTCPKCGVKAECGDAPDTKYDTPLVWDEEQWGSSASGLGVYHETPEGVMAGVAAGISFTCRDDEEIDDTLIRARKTIAKLNEYDELVAENAELRAAAEAKRLPPANADTTVLTLCWSAWHKLRAMRLSVQHTKRDDNPQTHGPDAGITFHRVNDEDCGDVETRAKATLEKLNEYDGLEKMFDALVLEEAQLRSVCVELIPWLESKVFARKCQDLTLLSGAARLLDLLRDTEDTEDAVVEERTCASCGNVGAGLTPDDGVCLLSSSPARCIFENRSGWKPKKVVRSCETCGHWQTLACELEELRPTTKCINAGHADWKARA